MAVLIANNFWHRQNPFQYSAPRSQGENHGTFWTGVVSWEWFTPPIPANTAEFRPMRRRVIPGPVKSWYDKEFRFPEKGLTV
jgi:hypothetical protein